MSTYQNPSEAGANLNVERYKERITNFSKEFELGLFIRIARQNLIYIASIVTVCIVLSFLYLRYTPATYQSSVVIQIGKDESQKSILGLEGIIEETNIDSKIELIRSPFIFKKSVEKLPMAVSYYHEGNLLTEEMYIHSLYKLNNLQIIDSTICGVRNDLVFTNNHVTISYAGNGISFEKKFKINEKIVTPHFKADIDISNLQGLVELQNENKIYFVINSSNILVAKLYPRLLIKLVNVNAQTVEISFQYSNPYVARDVVNAVAQSYNEFDSIKKSEGS